MKQSKMPLIITIFVLVFFYVPILVLVAQSFNAARFGGSWQGFTFRWYEELFQNHNVLRATRNTLLVAFITTVVSTLLGTLAGWALHHYKTGLQKVHYGFIYAPLVVPDILMGMSLLLLFVNLSIPLSLNTIIIAHITFCISYVTLVVLGRLQDFDFSLIEAAQDLGAGTLTIFWKILVPLLGPGIAAGALLAFTLSIDDFVITYLVAGPGSTTLPVYVYSMMKFGSPAQINALCVLFMAATFSIVILSQLVLNKKQ
ncbi:MAG: ABC transporter permease [Verrucomicrobia bacterium]|nr:ABC transporter permease [Verrucomicrobiota bacterium]